MGPKKTKTDIAAMLQTIGSALHKHYTKKALVLNGASWKVEELSKLFAEHIAQMKETDAARARWLQAAALQRKSQADVELVVVAIKGLVGSTFGEASSTFADFGFTPRRKRTRSVESKAVAVAKLRATRVARHTMGPRARLAIHGVLSDGQTAGTAAAVSTGSNGTPSSSTPTNGAAATNGVQTNVVSVAKPAA